ncbi:MAG TPA: molybdopterin-dependent oxidoreductase [Acidimicrobiales bacterium]|nr:molybdopterin-dependent oxidoreductase [Acidimicrobiales bacterium]
MREEFGREGSHLQSFPPAERWDDWAENDAKAWPQRSERHYCLVPTLCFNCEAACGLLVYVDKKTGEIARVEGNPLHPGSRGRVCAKGFALLNQVRSPDRILYPLRRDGPRGSGRWRRTTWDEVLGYLGGRIRTALQEGRGNEVMYHVGRPGHDAYMEHVLQAWGVDGHNSHTNICSASARLGYALWQGADRPSPDYANARCILLISAHLEAGHYFNPHAQRIMEAKAAGAKLIVVDPRLSNTASMADMWLSPRPGTEAAILLAMAGVVLRSGKFDSCFVRDWVNWQDYEGDGFTAKGKSFDDFVRALSRHYERYTPELAEELSGVPAEAITQAALDVAAAGGRFSSHIWRAAAAGNLGGWQAARALVLLHVLTGSVGTPGGLSPNTWDKFVPRPLKVPPPQRQWNELLYPPEWPLSHHELSQLLPHFLKEGRGRLDTYFTRVFNPVWTYPDGFSWLEVLRDEDLVGVHAALTPVWSETAAFADYVLPMGLACERHDVQSQETHAARWIGFRQPVLRVFRERERSETVRHTYEANPGEVWEEDEFWTSLSWHIDPDGSMGIRQWFESVEQPGLPLGVDEYYGSIFSSSVPGLPEAAAARGLVPLEYMRRFGAFELPGDVYHLNERAPLAAELEGAVVQGDILAKDGLNVAVVVRGGPVTGFATPSRKLELYSRTLRDWKWPEMALPEYVPSHVGPEALRAAAARSTPSAHTSSWPAGVPAVVWPPHADGETMTLVPIYRLPTLVHTRNDNAKWLFEISHRNPLLMAAADAARLGFATGDLVRVNTEIGWFVIALWVTEGLAPGVVACSHHLGRWRRDRDEPIERWGSSVVEVTRPGPGQWMLRVKEGARPWPSADPDSSRIWWTDTGVHQNLTFPVHPDPVSGMQCWHQLVKVQRALAGDRYGDVFADTAAAHQVYQRWKDLCRPAPGPGGLRRPLWLARAARPAPEAYLMS